MSSVFSRHIDSPTSIRPLRSRRRRWLLLLGSLLLIYTAFCPLVNEPLYQLLAVLPNREYIDLQKPVTMDRYTGEHQFFPVLKQAGKADKQILLHGVYFKTQTPKCRGVVILNPGNSFCLTHMLGCRPALKILERGYDLFVYDYEGFGESGGKASYKRLGPDALSAYEFIRSHVPNKTIILYGMSMGTGVSSYVAERRPVAAVIFDSPFISPERTSKDWFSILNLYPTQLYPEPRYDNGHFLAGRHPPALLVVKGCDGICWPTQGADLSRQASAPTTTIVLPNSQHIYIDDRDEAAYDQALSGFLNNLDSVKVSESAVK